MEKLGIETQSGKAKVLGTLMGIGGGMVLTFYKGAEIKIWSSSSHIKLNQQHQRKFQNSHLFGCLSSLGGSLSYAIWLIIQVIIIIPINLSYRCLFMCRIFILSDMKVVYIDFYL